MNTKGLFKRIEAFQKTDRHVSVLASQDMPTFSCGLSDLLAFCHFLYEDAGIQMHSLVDICVVDYLHYGKDEWQGQDASQTGFDRARTPLENMDCDLDAPMRFVLVYHFLSLSHRLRLRLRVSLRDMTVLVPSVTGIWPNANWYEREAFDLFGVRFSGHPGLRRIITDYGFVGYPMRKDFPLEGRVEMRYDAALERCLYEPVSIKNRVSVPKVIRHQSQGHVSEEDACG